MAITIKHWTRQARAALNVAAVAICMGQAIAAEKTTISVTLDEASLIKMPEKAQTLIIGNPVIADVTVLKNSRMMVITGKGYGQTNLIAIDSSGNPVAESLIRVSGNGSLLVVQRGAERETYSCAPRCMPTIQLGDGKIFADSITQVAARNGLAQPAATAR